jgi:hypothetical protein
MGRQSSGSDHRKFLMDREKWSPSEVCPTSGLDTAPARTGSAGFQPASRAGGSMPPARDLRRGSLGGCPCRAVGRTTAHVPSSSAQTPPTRHRAASAASRLESRRSRSAIPIPMPISISILARLAGPTLRRNLTHLQAFGAPKQSREAAPQTDQGTKRFLAQPARWRIEPRAQVSDGQGPRAKGRGGLPWPLALGPFSEGAARSVGASGARAGVREPHRAQAADAGHGPIRCRRSLHRPCIDKPA